MYEYNIIYTCSGCENGNTPKKRVNSRRREEKSKREKKMALSGQEIKGIRPIVYEQGEQYGEAEQAQPFS